TEVPWMYAVSECAPQEALHHLDHAFAHFFRRCKLKQDGRWKGKLGYPPRKTKQEGLGSFRLTGSIAVFSDAIQLHRLGREGQKARGCLPTTGTPGIKILSATLSEHAAHWYVSLQVEQGHLVPANRGPVVGV